MIKMDYTKIKQQKNQLIMQQFPPLSFKDDVEKTDFFSKRKKGFATL